MSIRGKFWVYVSSEFCGFVRDGSETVLDRMHWSDDIRVLKEGLLTGLKYVGTQKV